jgi:hypothetical protein
MWIERQNTQVKVYLGIALSAVVYQVSIISKFNKNAMLKNLLISLISIIVIVLIINWLVDNDHNVIAWILVLLPLVFIPTMVNLICKVCKLV